MKRPFDAAHWIWHGTPCMDLVNTFVQARREFTLKKVPKRSVVCVTADSSYRLFVNGRHVCRGPARGFQSNWPFDRVDIGPHLKMGANVVAVLAHSLGVHNARYLHTGWAGLALDGRVAGVDISTDARWKVRRSPGHLRTQTRLSGQTDFQEHFDARQDDAAWLLPGYDDASWSAASVYPTYTPPWPDFSERGLPMLTEERFPAKLLAAEGRGRGGELEENVVLSCFAANPRWRAAAQRLKRVKGHGETVLPVVRGRAVTYHCLDFGREVMGYPMIEVRDGTGGELLDLLLCEYVDESGTPCVNDPRTDVNGVALGHRLRLRKGTTRHEVHFCSGFRYLIVGVCNSPKPLRVRVAVRNISYPLDSSASFHSSEAVLNRIHRASALSAKCCMQDALVDCPQREQAQWWALRCAMNPALYLLSDTRIEARGLRQIAMQRAPNGLTYSTAPSFLHNWILPEICCEWIVNVGDYCAWSGDLEMFRDVAESVQSSLDWMHENTQRHAGLMATEYEGYFYRLFLPDSRAYRDNRALFSATHNLMYLRALRVATSLFRLCDEKRFAGRYGKRASELTKNILAQFGAPERPYLHGSLSPEFEPVPLPAREYNLFALALALVNDLQPAHRREVAEDIWHALNCVGRRIGPAVFKPTPGHLYFAMEALFQAGYRQKLVDYIRRYWSIWTDQRGLTTTPEHWWFEGGPDGKDALCHPEGPSALCHSWAIYPLEFFPRVILGIERQAAGWKRMRFAPEAAPGRSAEGCVPTPLGPISASWKRAGTATTCSLTVPDGMVAEIDLPGRHRTVRTGPFTESFVVPTPE